MIIIVLKVLLCNYAMSFGYVMHKNATSTNKNLYTTTNTLYDCITLTNQFFLRRILAAVNGGQNHIQENLSSFVFHEMNQKAIRFVL